VLSVNQSLTCFGDNIKKQSPGLVAGSYKAVATGGNTVCALSMNDLLFCLGSADSFKLGTQSSDSVDPVKISDSNFLGISVGTKHACVIDTSNNLGCWGSNTAGQLASSFGFPAAYADLIVSIGGTKAVGETIRAVAAGAERSVSYKYLWKRASSSAGLVASLTSERLPTYLVSKEDLGKFFSVEIQQSKWGTTSKGYLGKASGAIGHAIRLLLTPTPTVSGTYKVGRIVSARAGRWDSGVKFTYQWYRGTAAIKGATKPTLRLIAADIGKQLSVSVTGAKPGIKKVTKRSSKTPKVIR
jgi:hypothetical protein